MELHTNTRGSLTLHRSFHRSEWLRGGGLALTMLVLGAGLAVYGAYIVRDLLEVSRIWKEGHASPVEAGYGGRVTTHNFVLKDYALDVTFMVEETGEPQQFKAEFQRFFTGPDEGEGMTVKYMPEDPRQAVTSWQHEGLLHGWVWASMVWLMAGAALVGAVVLVRNTAKLTSTVDSLLRDGQLMLASVDEAKRGGTASAPVLVVKYKLPRHDESQKQTFTLKRGAPLFVGERQGVVLSSIDQKQSHMLREDGYPLAALPHLTKLGIQLPESSAVETDGAREGEDRAQAS